MFVKSLVRKKKAICKPVRIRLILDFSKTTKYYMTRKRCCISVLRKHTNQVWEQNKGIFWQWGKVVLTFFFFFWPGLSRVEVPGPGIEPAPHSSLSHLSHNARSPTHCLQENSCIDLVMMLFQEVRSCAITQATGGKLQGMEDGRCRE